MERLAWLSLVFVTWGTATYLLKFVGMRLDHSSGALGIVIGYVITGLLPGAGGGGKLGMSWGYVGAFATGACYIIGNWAFMRLGRLEDVSVIAPITSLSVLIPILLGLILLGEPMTLRKGIGIFLALIATVLLATP